jgi:hypothetical protein
MESKYKTIKLKDGTTKHEHRYLMQQHLGRVLLRNEFVHHKDGNSRNNELSNLEVMIAKQHNLEHNHTARLRPGIPPIILGSANPTSKLREDQVLFIRDLFSKQRKGIRKYARLFGVSHTLIIKILNRDIWKHI